MELYFVRHGQTEWNAIRKLQGIMDSPLTEEGVSQAILLRKSFKASFTKCISSPLGRAKKTAEILIEGSAISLETNKLLCEMSFGAVEGLEKEHFKAKYPESFYNLWHHADIYEPFLFQGETFLSVEERAKRFLANLQTEPRDSRILIVSHGMILKVLFGVIWQHSLEHFWEDPVPLNTSITKVVYTQNRFEIVDFSNVSHLPKMEVISYV